MKLISRPVLGAFTKLSNRIDLDRRLDRAGHRSTLKWDDATLQNCAVAFPRIAIGTHHKTGTVWLRSIFVDYARATEATFVHSRLGPLTRGARRTIHFDSHSRFDGSDLAGARGLHMVRDPRDVILSSMHYHRKSSESWLHEPRFDGLSYQQKINALNDTDAMLFEIDHAAGDNIRDMVTFDRAEAEFRTIRYEDFITDTPLNHWRGALEWLGLDGIDMIVALNAVYRNSLFGGGARKQSHVRNGGTNQWKGAIPGAVLVRFEERFSSALEKLGYA